MSAAPRSNDILIFAPLDDSYHVANITTSDLPSCDHVAGRESQPSPASASNHIYLKSQSEPEVDPPAPDVARIQEPSVAVFDQLHPVTLATTFSRLPYLPVHAAIRAGP